MKPYLLPLFLCITVLVSCNATKEDDSMTDDGQSDDGNGTSLVFVNAFPNLNFDRPLDFQTPNDGSGRVFVVEQGGVIKVFENDATVEETAIFLDISNKIGTNANEQGLLGLAFHPNFESNGYFYVNYTPTETLSVTSRFQVSSANANGADPNSEQILLEIAQPYTNHNGGQLAFGPDGYLYIASGDGGSGGDPQNNAQNRSNLLGAILRIDIDNVSTGLNYAIPADNPFIGENGVRGEIFAFGLRNPWRMSFDDQTGELWSGDVGQGEREEINIIVSGGNFGWKLFEGTFCFSGDCDDTGLEPPIFEYNHDAGDKSITGGFVYRGNAVASLQGKYVYADFISGRIWALTLDGSDNEILFNTGLNIASFGVDAQNELYFCAFDGSIYTFQEE
ncbi:PQQ-dependent sugar dehydrogenase [Flagellimonas lutaonensis]|uniref:Protein up-regulated by thyroid hormone-putative PQQ-dependent glucose dehydrogenase n=1 Tax=Flagellimonas lutaonensis TaxID=516051 RepID=A0A0D5YQ48_9FLAO|nr:PQQ-dependent sugar dehydrogenase [Allomuricauda lutaonensis]AKA34024.1 Protein up-regulated by thyroid hormone-putative PQQ-dependent glucose dehydrogenase [Allomuricauda lutaonensis]